MWNAIILLLLGLIFIFIEFYVPGGIMAIAGSIILISSIVVFALETYSILGTVLFSVSVVVSVTLLIKWTLKYIPKTPKGYSIYLNSDQEGFRATQFDASLVGKHGTVTTDLKPAGYVTIEGKKHSAISQTGYIPSGTEIIVIRGEEDNLIVKRSS